MKDKLRSLYGPAVVPAIVAVCLLMAAAVPMAFASQLGFVPGTGNAQIGAVSPLLDTNGNGIFGFTATGSAKNYVGVTNNTAGNGPTIAPTGLDDVAGSGVSITLKAAGSGTVSLPSTNSFGSSTILGPLSSAMFAMGSTTLTMPVGYNHFTSSPQAGAGAVTINCPPTVTNGQEIRVVFTQAANDGQQVITFGTNCKPNGTLTMAAPGASAKQYSWSGLSDGANFVETSRVGTGM